MKNVIDLGKEKSMMNTVSKFALTMALALPAASPAFASSAPQVSAPAQQAAEASTPISEGEIRKVDKDAGKVTIKHGELKNLDMPPMTMVFRVKDSSMLDQVKAGDKIRFVADKINGAFTVTKLEVVR